VRFSVTIRVDKKVRAAIETIPAAAWVDIAYPQPIWDDQQHGFISRARIAQTRYTAFDGTPLPGHRAADRAPHPGRTCPPAPSTRTTPG
jgi:hypothetical protein